MEPTFIEMFCGIGGFRLGLERSGWRCLWANDNDKSACRIYQKNFGDKELIEKDIEKIEIETISDHTLLTAGFPCQDLSVAGKRRGLSGERSALFWEILRVAEGKKTPLLLLENVPGLLSSNNGRDFALVLASLADIGYGLAWRVLDSQHFGVPQRRRRVFIVGCLGKPCPPEILFESEGVSGDTQKGGKAGKDVAYCLRERPSHSGDKGDGGVNTTLIAPTVRQQGPRGREAQKEFCIVSPTLQAGGAGTDRTSQRGNGYQFCIINGQTVDPDRVREASGVPRRVDVHLCPDSPRYRSLGNAVTVNVIEWIGKRMRSIPRAGDDRQEELTKQETLEI